QQAFHAAGLGHDEEAPEVVAARVRASNIRAALLAALDHWSMCTQSPERRAWVLEVARKADPEPLSWRGRARAPSLQQDDRALSRLIAPAPVAEPSVSLLLALANHLKPASPQRVPFLKKVQQAHPGDFWINLRLGYELMQKGLHGEAVGYFQAA